MEPPKSAAYRSRPDQTRFFLDQFGLEYFVRFPTTANCQTATTMQGQLPLINKIQQLASCGGQNTLEVVTVTHEASGNAGYLVRRTTQTYAGPSEAIWECTLSQDKWYELMSSPEAKAWSLLLDDLITRKSDRAYLHVQQRLAINETPSIEVLRWADSPPQTANEILALNMRQITDTPGMLRLEPIRYLDPMSAELLLVRLPCEHEMQISEQAIAAFSEQQCLDAQCPTCDGAILPSRDITKFHCSLERRRQVRKRCDEHLWRRIEREDSGWLSVDAPFLAKALRHPLRSMQVPQSPSPSVLSPAQSLETAAILRKTLKLCENATRGVKGTTEEVHSMIMEEAQDALRELYGCAPHEAAICTLPGWSPFLARWLERPVKLAAQLDYQGEDEWEVYGGVPDADIIFEDESAVDGVEALLYKTVI